MGVDEAGAGARGAGIAPPMRPAEWAGRRPLWWFSKSRTVR